MDDKNIKKPRIKRLPRNTGGLGLLERTKKRHQTGVVLRGEHYLMLRELSEFYDNAPLMRLTGALIVQEYCKILSKTDPEKAQLIKESYENKDLYYGYITRLAD
jgi:hypothetical protein